jgi:hypothetical protein
MTGRSGRWRGRRLVATAGALVPAILGLGCQPHADRPGPTTPAHSTPAAGTPAAGTPGPGPVSPPATPTADPGHWTPRQGTTWQWQLSGPLDLSVDAQVYDVDLVETTADQVRRLHAAGRRAICYISAGTWEPGRPDARRYPPTLLGRPLADWPDERWLDIRRRDLLEPLIGARLDLCAAKGFDGVEPDNLDGYANDTGFPLTPADQLTFNRAVARLAHARGLAVGLKNDVEQAGILQPDFDFAVDEQCVQYSECDLLSAFPRAGKPVFHVEYTLTTTQFCPVTQPLGFSSISKPKDLSAARTPCP